MLVVKSNISNSAAAGDCFHQDKTDICWRKAEAPRLCGTIKLVWHLNAGHNITSSMSELIEHSSACFVSNLDLGK